MTAHASIDSMLTPDTWLSTILDRHVGRLDWPTKPDYDLIKGQLKSALPLLSSPTFIYTKVPTDDVMAGQLLEDVGFRLVETNVVFEKGKSDRPVHHGAKVRVADPADEEGCAKIAGSFLWSRFHMDPLFSKEQADLIKVQWVRNFFRGSRGTHMLIAIDETSAITGFLQLIRVKNELIIDLIGVAEHARRQGVARSLIEAADGVLLGPDEKYLVGTQVANTASVRLYESLGFRLARSQYSFHFHR